MNGIEQQIDDLRRSVRYLSDCIDQSPADNDDQAAFFRVIDEEPEPVVNATITILPPADVSRVVECACQIIDEYSPTLNFEGIKKKLRDCAEKQPEAKPRKYDFASTSIPRWKMSEMLNDMLVYTDDAKKALGNFYITGRPVADCIKDMHEHINDLIGSKPTFKDRNGNKIDLSSNIAFVATTEDGIPAGFYVGTVKGFNVGGTVIVEVVSIPHTAKMGGLGKIQLWPLDRVVLWSAGEAK